jgi:small subunit ribosomal protein S4
VSHGHITINGVRITTPSHRVRPGDVIAVREGSRTSPLFAGLSEVNPETARVVPKWITSDLKLMKADIVAEPTYNSVDAGLDYPTVFEFYSR